MGETERDYIQMGQDGKKRIQEWVYGDEKLFSLEGKKSGHVPHSPRSAVQEKCGTNSYTEGI